MIKGLSLSNSYQICYETTCIVLDVKCTASICLIVEILNTHDVKRAGLTIDCSSQDCPIISMYRGTILHGT